jgi:predicted nucleic acid-binding protein
MMILDTNVFSAAMTLERHPVIEGWLDQIDRTLLSITVVTVFEVRLGIEQTPAGKKREGLERDFARLMTGAFSEPARVFQLDGRAADQTAGHDDRRHRDDARPADRHP